MHGIDKLDSMQEVPSIPGGEASWFNQGVLGLVVLLTIAAIVALWRQLLKERTSHKKEMTEQTDSCKKELVDMTDLHRRELRELRDRFIEQTTMQVRDYHTLAEKTTSVLDSLARRVDRRGRYGGE